MERTRLILHYGTAVVLTLSGVALLFMGFWVAPKGIIDSSVLIAFGEIMTCAGALYGIRLRRVAGHLEADTAPKTD